MATVGDSTDPQGTKRPNEDLIIDTAHIFNPVIVADRLLKPCLPSNIFSNDLYAIFCLFFTNEVLQIIAENTNKYADLHKVYTRPRVSWKKTLIVELKAYLEVLLYCSLYSPLKRSNYWSISYN